MKKLPFTGSGVALITPFNSDGTPNYDKLDELIEMHIAHKTDALIVCGTTGEAPTLPDSDHLEVIKHTVEKAAGRIVVIGGTGSNYTQHAIEFSQKAEEYGCDAVLCVTPYYNKASQKGLVEHYTAIANSISIPVILYNVPSRTGVNLSIPALKELAKVENIVAVKEASGNISYATKIRKEVPELYMYSGNDDIIVPVMSIGGKGVISVVANILPEETHNICEYYLNGETDKSLSLQLQMLDLINNLFIEVNPIPVKTAMNLLGYDVGGLNLPLCDMEEKNLNILKKSLEDYGVKKL
ncbi:MAG: 4-hydroxy-tetrahydrodipicolinate synthase [Clostridiales bacterium]|nr:4-hydroxy-tetrahydrodipicolinate synthase [Clostridiales bacterium]